jgi:hypothetical protein
MTRQGEQLADGLTDEEMMSLSELDARELDIEKKLEELAPGSVLGDGSTKFRDDLGDKQQDWDALIKERREVRGRIRQLEKRANPSS